jgi:hypothetical protein
MEGYVSSFVLGGQMSSVRRRVAEGAALTAPLIVLLAILGLVRGPDDRPTQDTRIATEDARANPVALRGGGLGNVSFYYQGSEDLAPGSDLSGLGASSVVVATGGGDEAAKVEAIHSTGAKAYRYVQYYWAPEGRAYEGVDLPSIRGWAYCGTRSVPLEGRTVGGVRWLYLDTNETKVRQAVRASLRAIRERGWDGVFFDRGAAATQAVVGPGGRRHWWRSSTCTEEPVQAGASFSTAYRNTLGLAHRVGLEAMVNNGRSPFDPVIPMRPDPRDRDCRAAQWSACSTRDDFWDRVDLVLNEVATRPRLEMWTRLFKGHQRAERDAVNGRRTVALVTTSGLGGEQGQTRSGVFYGWSRIKLFNLPVAVNTGDDGCEGSPTGSVCNRHDLYPELVDTRLGPPLSSGPSSRACVPDSRISCVWVRRYRDGVVLVNATPSARTVRVSTGGTQCRRVLDVYREAPAAEDACVTGFSVRIPAWSGRPFTYLPEQ